MDSQGMPARVSDWDKRTSCRKDSWRARSMRPAGEGRLQQGVCYREGYQTRGMDSEQRRKDKDLYLANLFGVVDGFPGDACWCWGLD